MSSNNITYKELEDYYKKHFSLCYINTDINSKFALISLICIAYKEATKNKKATYLEVVKALSKGIDLPEDFLWTLAIICEDYSYGCNNFLDFGLKGKQIIEKIREILQSWVPF